MVEDRPICSCKPGFTGTLCQGRVGGAGELSLPTGTKEKGDKWGALVLPLWAPGVSPSSWFGCIPPPLPPCPDYSLIKDPVTSHFLPPQQT